MKYAVSILAVLAASSAAHAADLVVDTPMEPISQSSGMKGVVEVGVLGQFVSQTDDSFDGWAGGGYASGALWGVADSLIWGIDAYGDANSFDSTGHEAATYVGALGGHLGFGGDAGMIGGFASVGVAPDYNDAPEAGYTVGIEGMTKLDSIGLFGQLGWADIRTDGTDSGFTGPFVRAGALFALSDDMAVMVDASYGHTNDFEDAGDEGVFATAGVKAAFKLPTDFNAFVTAGYEYSYYQANTEDDGFSHTIKLGLSIPFGDSTTASDALNPLATSVQPYRAASWAETLD